MVDDPSTFGGGYLSLQCQLSESSLLRKEMYVWYVRAEIETTVQNEQRDDGGMVLNIWTGQISLYHVRHLRPFLIPQYLSLLTQEGETAMSAITGETHATNQRELEEGGQSVTSGSPSSSTRPLSSITDTPNHKLYSASTLNCIAWTWVQKSRNGLDSTLVL